MFVSADINEVVKMQTIIVKANRVIEDTVEDMRRCVNRAGGSWNDGQFVSFQGRVDEFISSLNSPMSDLTRNAGKLDGLIVDMRNYLSAK